MPLIGITTGLESGGPRPRDAYCRSVEQAGGTTILIHPGQSSMDLDAVWRKLGGLILSGGGDVDPARYGEPAHPNTGGISAERDEMEIRLALKAVGSGLPLFAICRGIQVLNVALGGTLVQDIPSGPRKMLAHDSKGERGVATHAVTVEEGTRLAAALGTTTASTNSFHHQAVRRPGRGLRVVAHTGDGVIEGVEGVGGDAFLLGVQWHPEEMTLRDAPSLALFKALVVAASAVR